jgi:iron only hydrogenase large subunit-like protein
VNLEEKVQPVKSADKVSGVSLSAKQFNWLNLIKNNEAVAMLAPTFAIDFKYPNIIGMLRHLGFKEVTELTFGARMVNWAYENYIKEHLDQELFIASPCPTVVAMVQNQYPELVKYLMPIISPMAAMAKVHKKFNPDCKVVFISPCWAKENVEAPKFKEIDAVITLQDLKQIFEQEGIKEEDFTVHPHTKPDSVAGKNLKKYGSGSGVGASYYFDSFIREYTKIYPVSGGLASTSHIQKLFKDHEIFVTDGVENIKKAFEDFKNKTKPYRFLDLLNCDGGCIGGPAINRQDLSIDQRKEIIFEYTHRSSEATMGGHEGKVKDARDIDLTTKF